MSQEAIPGWPDQNMIEAAHGIICNVDMGNWEAQSDHWQRAATAWVEAYHRQIQADYVAEEEQLKEATSPDVRIVDYRTGQ